MHFPPTRPRRPAIRCRSRAVKQIVIYLSAATNFDRVNSQAMMPEGWQAKAVRDLDLLTGKSADDVENAAVRDHRQYFDRLDVDFGQSSDAILSLPTKARLNRIKAGEVG